MAERKEIKIEPITGSSSSRENISRTNDDSLVESLRTFFERRNGDSRSIKIAKFWRNRPALWFVTLENEFLANNIQADDIKYTTAIRHLDEQTVTDVSDILKHPPEDNKYGTLKKTLIERFSETLDEKIRALVAATELGNKKPSELLREMQRLAKRRMEDAVIKTLWIQKLPMRIQELFTIIEEDAPLNKLAEYADKTHAKSKTTLVDPMFAISSLEKNSMKTALAELTEQVN